MESNPPAIMSCSLNIYQVKQRELQLVKQTINKADLIKKMRETGKVLKCTQEVNSVKGLEEELTSAPEVIHF